MHRDRMGRAAAYRIRWREQRSAVVIDFRDQAIGRRTGFAGERAGFEDMTNVIGETGLDAATNHVRGKQRGIAGAAGQNELGAGLERRDQGMDAHLSDDYALAESILS